MQCEALCLKINENLDKASLIYLLLWHSNKIWNFNKLQILSEVMSNEFHCMKSIQIRSFFWSAFYCIRTEYGDLLRKSPYSVRLQENARSKSPYSVWIQKNADQKKLRIWALFTQCLISSPGSHILKCDFRLVTLLKLLTNFMSELCYCFLQYFSDIYVIWVMVYISFIIDQKRLRFLLILTNIVVAVNLSE